MCSLRVQIIGPSHGEHKRLLSGQEPKRGCTDPTLRSGQVIVRGLFPTLQIENTLLFFYVCCLDFFLEEYIFLIDD